MSTDKLLTVAVLPGGGFVVQAQGVADAALGTAREAADFVRCVLEDWEPDEERLAATAGPQ